MEDWNTNWSSNFFPKPKNCRKRLGFYIRMPWSKTYALSQCYSVEQEIHFLFNGFPQAVIVSQNLFLQRIRILVILFSTLILITHTQALKQIHVFVYIYIYKDNLIIHFVTKQKWRLVSLSPQKPNCEADANAKGKKFYSGVSWPGIMMDSLLKAHLFRSWGKSNYPYQGEG